MLLTRIVVTVLVLLAAGVAESASLRFFGNGVGAPDQDRVKIRLDDPANGDPGPPADIGGGDFTVEFWMKAAAADNGAGPVSCGANINWIYGNIVFDRDRYNQDRKFGISIAGGQVVFGVSGDGTGDRTICGSTDVLDAEWHHVALERRRSDGHLWLYVDGVLEDDTDGPDGDVSYPDAGVPCSTCCGGGPCDSSDPFLVIAAEKHDAGAAYPSYAGRLDEVRLSSTLRYGGASFTPPVAAFVPDATTVALYHFDEQTSGACTGTVVDASGAPGGPSDGVCQHGGSPSGPLYDAESPFDPPPPPVCAPAPLATCKAADRSSLVLKAASSPDKDQWIWKWGKGAATTLAELGLPTAATTYALCLYGNGAALDELNVPAHPLRWKPNGTTGFRYKATDGLDDGVRTVLLKAGEAGKARVQLKGQGAALPDPAMPLALPVTVQLVNGDDAGCWESIFGAPGVMANDAARFKGRAP